MTEQSDVKTIHEFLADNPNIDVSKQWERCWNIHGRIADRIIDYFGAELHSISKGAEYYTSPDGQMEGAFFGYTGNDMDWFVRSWIGNRKASIIDMNINVVLGQKTQVPNLMIIFGTVPKLLFYADYVPRVDLKVNEEYVKKFYEGDVNQGVPRLPGQHRLCLVGEPRPDHSRHAVARLLELYYGTDRRAPRSVRGVSR